MALLTSTNQRFVNGTPPWSTSARSSACDSRASHWYALELSLSLAQALRLARVVEWRATPGVCAGRELYLTRKHTTPLLPLPTVLGTTMAAHAHARAHGHVRTCASPRFQASTSARVPSVPKMPRALSICLKKRRALTLRSTYLRRQLCFAENSVRQRIRRPNAKRRAIEYVESLGACISVSPKHRYDSTMAWPFPKWLLVFHHNSKHKNKHK